MKNPFFRQISEKLTMNRMGFRNLPHGVNQSFCRVSGKNVPFGYLRCITLLFRILQWLIPKTNIFWTQMDWNSPLFRIKWTTARTFTSSDLTDGDTFPMRRKWDTDRPNTRKKTYHIISHNQHFLKYETVWFSRILQVFPFQGIWPPSLRGQWENGPLFEQCAYI